MISALFWGVTLRRLVVWYRLTGLNCLLLRYETDRLSRNVGNKLPFCTAYTHRRTQASGIVWIWQEFKERLGWQRGVPHARHAWCCCNDLRHFVCLNGAMLQAPATEHPNSTSTQPFWVPGGRPFVTFRIFWRPTLAQSCTAESISRFFINIVNLIPNCTVSWLRTPEFVN